MLHKNWIQSKKGGRSGLPVPVCTSSGVSSCFNDCHYERYPWTSSVIWILRSTFPLLNAGMAGTVGQVLWSLSQWALNQKGGIWSQLPAGKCAHTLVSHGAPFLEGSSKGTSWGGSFEFCQMTHIWSIEMFPSHNLLLAHEPEVVYGLWHTYLGEDTPSYTLWERCI